ncbi:MAG: PD-(D/E)XK nuclease family protein, partial [Clostridia bacterium]|nr:PD-(D/E)XK nuclease family protein [Clostridia bacterium]
ERKLDELCEKLIENGEDVLSDFAKKGYDCFLEVLNETERLLSDRTLDITEFRDLILSSCAGLEISLLPRYNDCVFMGDYRSTRIRRAKVLFCVGLTGDTPFFKSDDALLSDRELARMEGFRLVVEPKISIVNKREIENVATTLMSFDEKLYATYPLLSVKGEKAGKGQVVDDIIRAFTSDGKSPFLSLEGERATRSAEGVEGYLSKGAGIKNYFKAIEAFKNKTIDDLTAAGSFLKALSRSDKALYSYALSAGKGTELIREGLSYSGGLSASLVESYFSCPYSAFGSKILGLKERESGEIKPKEYGVFIPAVLEKFALVCDSIDDLDVEPTAKKIVEVVAKRDEYARYNEKKRFAFGLAEAKAEAIKECVRIYRMQKRSDFRVFGTEIRFGDDQKAVLPPVLVSTPFGDKKISGYIDRMDVCENEKGEKLARVIDYKTGSSVKNKADVSNLYTGRNVQLYLYLNAVKNGGYEPAGAHYYASNDDFIDKGSERRTFYGAMLSDEDVLSSMDHSLTGGGKSADYGVDAKKSGKDLIDERAMQGLIEYAKLVTEMGAEEMAKGCFAPSPMTGACTYCAMRGACRFDGDEPSLSREEIKADDEKIIKAVEEANDEKN